jgi:hypothetical protein
MSTKPNTLADLINPQTQDGADMTFKDSGYTPYKNTQFTPEQSKQAKFFKEYKGWSDDQIHSYFNPKPEMTALDIFTQTKKEPEAPDPKRLQNNERVAAIAQGVGTLADIFSGVMGARVQKNNNPSPYAIVKGKNDELKKTYELKLENYNQGKQAAMLQDVMYKQGKDAQTRAVAEGQYYQQQQQDAAEAKADARYDERRAQQLEDYKTQVDYQTDAINNRSNYRNSNKSTSGKTTTDKYTPEQVVEINKEFKRIPEDFLIQNGAPTKEVTIEEGKPPFQTKRRVRVVDYDAVKPEIMNEYIRRYSGQQTQNTSTEQTNNTKPRTNQPTAGVMPGLKKITSPGWDD